MIEYYKITPFQLSIGGHLYTQTPKSEENLSGVSITLQRRRAQGHRGADRSRPVHPHSLAKDKHLARLQGETHRRMASTVERKGFCLVM